MGMAQGSTHESLEDAPLDPPPEGLAQGSQGTGGHDASQVSRLDEPDIVVRVV